MNAIQEAAFHLDLVRLRSLRITQENVSGALLAACSAHDADPRKQVEVLRYLKSKGADPDERDKNGVTPLHRAVRFRSPAAVRSLINMGADVDARDKKNLSTALHRAVTNTGAPGTEGKAKESRSILKLLIQSGADTRIKNKMGKQAIEYVKDEELKKMLVAFKRNVKSLI